LAGILTAGFFPIGATMLLQAGALGLTAAQRLTALFSSLPLVSWELAPPTLPLLALYYALLVGWLFGRPYRPVRTAALPLLLASIILAGFYPKLISRDTPTSVTFLDVGQGAATLLQLTEGQSILVDGGSDSRRASSFDLGEQVIAPFLRYRGLSRLDGLVISHDHADHYNGLPYIVEHFRPRTVWINSAESPSPGLKRIIGLAAAAGSQIRVPLPDEVLCGSPTAQLVCLGSFHLLPGRVDSENSRSLVLELRSGAHRIVLPGDIMAEDGELLLREKLTGEIAVLLAPHHGSDNSASQVLTRALRPAWIVVSAGAAPDGGFPGPELLAWCEANQTRVHRTGKEGAITFEITPTAISWRKLSRKGAPEVPGSGQEPP
jgi:competence protein ComEC